MSQSALLITVLVAWSTIGSASTELVRSAPAPVLVVGDGARR